jgi:hypothetical protein
MPNDPVADALKTPEGQAAEALRIAKELEDKLNKAPDVTPPVPNSKDYRDRVKAETGMTDAQIDFMENTARAASAGANEAAAMATVKSKHPGDFDKFEKDIREELASYDIARRTDPNLVEKVYHMVKGKAMDKNPKNPAPPIRGGNPADTGLDNGGGSGGPEALDDQERYVARKMGLSEKEYAQAKGTKLIHELK